MSFWKSLSNITGKVEDSTARRKQIPDNTFLQARIDSVELKIHDFKEYFKVTWVVESDEFKGFRVSQNIKFDVEDNAKSLAALNMVARLFILAGKPLPQDKPGVIDWMGLYSHVYVVQVNSGEINGYYKSWVSQVFKDFNDPDLPIQAKEQASKISIQQYQHPEAYGAAQHAPASFAQYAPPITESELKKYNQAPQIRNSSILSDVEKLEQSRKTRGIEAIDEIKRASGLYGSSEKKTQGEFVDDEIPF